MATTYGIEVKNRFELVGDDEDDPFEILKEQEEQAKKKDGDKTKKNAKNEKAKSAKTKQSKKAQIIEPEPSKPKQTEHSGGRREENPPPRRQREQSARNTDTDRPQSDRRPPRQNRGPRQDRQNDDFTPRDQGFSSGGEFRSDRPESARGTRGGRRGGGFGRGRGRGGFGKREFDRHSGSDKTGVKPVDKRDGGGAFNWGTVKDDVDDQLNTTNLSEEITDWTATNEDTENQDPNESTEVAEEPAEPEEEEPKEMTLDEWKAMQNKQRVKAEFNLRRPGEGVDDAQWNKTYVLSKKPMEQEESDEEEESDDEDRHGRKQHVVPIEITFSDNPRRGGGRRGAARGGGRGRGEGGFGRGEGGFSRPESGGFGRGGDRGGFSDRGGFGGRGREGGFGRGGRGGRGGRDGFRGGPRGRKETAPKFDDENDFPALTAKGS